MSYILDALKKSESDRGHGSIPGVQTVHSSSLNYSNEKRVYWPYILITAVLFNLAAILYFISDKEKPAIEQAIDKQSQNIDKNQQQAVSPDKAAPLASINTAANTAVQTPLKNDSIKPEIVEKQTVISPAVSTGETNTAAKAAASKNTVNKEPAVKKVVTKKITASPQAASPKAASPQAKVIDYHDLAGSIKQQLPAIVISAHVYSSNPLQRSIVINNNFLEEGEYILDGLTLHEITKDGAILNFNDTLFHYGVVSSWQ